MTVRAISYQAQLGQRVIAMLSQSPTWQQVCGVTSAVAALGRIIESRGGTAVQNAAALKATATDGSVFTLVPPFAHVFVAKVPSRLIGVGVFEHNGEVDIHLTLPLSVAADTPAEQFRRAQNQADGIRLEVESSFGQTWALARGAVDLDGPYLGADQGAEADAFVATLHLHYEG